LIESIIDYETQYSVIKIHSVYCLTCEVSLIARFPGLLCQFVLASCVPVTLLYEAESIV